VIECEYGTYNPGGNHNPCTSCGEGYNTSSNGNSTHAIKGATSRDNCTIAAGWAPDGSNGLKPCTQGYYKELMGDSSCVQCPSGTSTTSVHSAIFPSDCDVCAPGFSNYTADAASSPTCTICPSGTYSFGLTHGSSDTCQQCVHPAHFTGTMVSRPGTSNPDECLPEFTTDGADNDLAYDVIAMSESALTVTADDSLTACQQACHVDAACQYYVFYDYKPTTQKCGLRNKVAYSTVNLNDTSKSYVLFEVRRAGLVMSFAAVGLH